jgi:hypothetical protein
MGDLFDAGSRFVVCRTGRVSFGGGRRQRADILGKGGGG